jgi:hypothetical protein
MLDQRSAGQASECLRRNPTRGQNLLRTSIRQHTHIRTTILTTRHRHTRTIPTSTIRSIILRLHTKPVHRQSLRRRKRSPMVQLGCRCQIRVQQRALTRHTHHQHQHQLFRTRRDTCSSWSSVDPPQRTSPSRATWMKICGRRLLSLSSRHRHRCHLAPRRRRHRQRATREHSRKELMLKRVCVSIPNRLKFLRR